ncbi:hypothetical protein [Lacibacter sp. H407]|uniref:hypothetical protein n=1 Tax=Lacibacter sp. H407 TaxID=3133423 RepID=UPI0030C352AC
MPKFAVIIPFRPKAESVDWVKESSLLRETIYSVLRQTYESVHIFVVYTDAPDFQIDDSRIRYDLFPYGYQEYEEMENRDLLLGKFKSKKLVVRRWDKARKLCYASKLAKESGCDFIMALDADDRLSNSFFEYLTADLQKHTRKGWYLEKGYLYRAPSNYLIRIPKNMRFLNGSTHVLHTDLVTIPDFQSLVWEDFNLFTDHGWIKDRMKIEMNVEIYPVKQAMVVYVVHQSNISQIGRKEFGFRLKAIVKRIVRFVPLTKRLREEFNITPR